MKVRIEVGQEDIDQGCKASASYCPIARAVGRVIRGPVSVGAIWITLEDSTVYLTDEARQWVWDFDNDRDVEPFSFEIDVPEEATP
jgi:hypothetical protein